MSKNTFLTKTANMRKDCRVKKPGIEFRVAGRDNEEVSFDNLRVWELK